MVVRANPAEAHGLLRATLLAAFSALLTAAGHVAGGGRLPDLTMLAVLLPLLAGLFTAVAERYRSPLGTIAVLGSGQLALHLLIEVLNPTHTAHHAAATAEWDLGGTAGWGMLAMHALATLVTAAALRFADRAVAAIAAALGRIVPRRPRPLGADRPLASMATPGPAVTLRLASALAAARVRRGPPVGC